MYNHEYERNNFRQDLCLNLQLLQVIRIRGA